MTTEQVTKLTKAVEALENSDAFSAFLEMTSNSQILTLLSDFADEINEGNFSGYVA